MRNIALTIAYDGTDFLGWQKTSFGKSIEGVLEEVLQKILQHPVSLQAASRTDAGVHAEGQIVNFFTATERYTPSSILRSLQALLPKEIAAISAEEKPESFHPTLDAKGKRYRYCLTLGPYQMPSKRLYSWHYSYPLDIAMMEKSSNMLIGAHDFSGFCNDKTTCLKNPLCHLEEIAFEKENETLSIFLQGDRFLYKMVRNIIGTLVYIGSKRLSPSALTEMLEKKDRTLGGITAPSHGLTLQKIFYNPD